VTEIFNENSDHVKASQEATQLYPSNA